LNQKERLAGSGAVLWIETEVVGQVGDGLLDELANAILRFRRER
jgi:hypothetical protein